MNKENTNVTIVGAGPAGLSAAITLAKYGVHSTILDDNSNYGGAIYKVPERGMERSIFKDEKTFVKARELFKKVEHYSEYIHFKFNHEVLGNLDIDNKIVASDGVTLSQFDNKRLILCAGCYENSIPFEGWTLPGIMTVGGIQLQAKCGNVQPGKNVALVGTGPLLLLAAKQLHMIGVNVVAVVEAGRRSQLVNKGFSLLKQKDLLLEGLGYIKYLKKEKIPLYYGYGVVRAEGENELTKLVIAPYSKEWEPIRSKAITLDVDAAGIGYGYVPRIQLTQMLNCDHEYDPNRGGFIPVTDEWQRTSQKGIYVAGDMGGIFGSQMAIYQGEIAGLAYLEDNGYLSVDSMKKEVKGLRKKMNNLKRFQSSFYKFSSLKKGLTKIQTPETIVCRCENVKLQELDKSIKEGAKDMMTLKMTTRVGMGDCQGKMCGNFCSMYMSEKLNCSREKVGTLRPRFPMAAVSFGVIVKK
ncbi:MAG: NAD(P)/FAD-dependent oxidoreductase [Saprospiraceae bacterium]|nr:NAD(P)/FAD-dependent oxidoreductase [Saprospiraceae bacterium]